MPQPTYPGALPAAEVAARLAEAAVGPAHSFWPDDVNLLGQDTLEWTRVLGHRQITDAYLLALAVRHEGRLVMSDRRIDVKSAYGATTEHLETVSE